MTENVIVDDAGVLHFDKGTALRYGGQFGEWDPAAPVRVANFILGHDVETRTTVLNERMLDVVHPIEEFWDPENGSADIEIVELGRNGRRLAMGLGQWVVRYNTGSLRVMSLEIITERLLPSMPAKTFRQDLAAVINRHSKENGSNTPDHILADFLIKSLGAFDAATNNRRDWMA